MTKILLICGGVLALILLDCAASTFTVTTTSASGPGSLPQAITDANTSSGNEIHFNLPGPGVQVINLTGSSLPVITNAMTIDARTQPGYVGTPLIECRGAVLPISGPTGVRLYGLAITHSSSYGIEIFAPGGSHVIVGCQVLSNTLTGILIAGAANNTIGGAGSQDRNVISGNGGFGIILTSSANNLIAGNFIGTDASGLHARPNAGGIQINNSANNRIGAPGYPPNVISGNNGDGLTQPPSQAPNTTNNVVQNNFIGVGADGVTPLGNVLTGITITSPASVIGGLNTSERNVIAFNSSHGVFISQSGNTILGNTIQSNGQSGVAVCCAGVTNNLVRQNSIIGNGALGIDLVDTNSVYGVTANDPCDTDTGGNELQNFPVLNYALGIGDGVIVNGSLNSHANTSYRLEFFANDVCSGSGYGQGKTYLGSANVTTDGSCNADFQATLSSPVASGQFVTATATDPNNNTSEFSACAPVIAFRLLSIKRQDNDIHLMWSTLAGKTNFVQRASSPTGGFVDLGPMIILGGTGQVNAAYVDLGGGTSMNFFYRMRLIP